MGLLGLELGGEFLIFLVESLDEFGKFLIFNSQDLDFIFHRLILFFNEGSLRIFKVLSILGHQVYHSFKFMNDQVLLIDCFHKIIFPEMRLVVSLVQGWRFNVRMSLISFMTRFLARCYKVILVTFFTRDYELFGQLKIVMSLCVGRCVLLLVDCWLDDLLCVCFYAGLMLCINRQCAVIHVTNFFWPIGWCKLTHWFADTHLVRAHCWPDWALPL